MDQVVSSKILLLVTEGGGGQGLHNTEAKLFPGYNSPSEEVNLHGAKSRERIQSSKWIQLLFVNLLNLVTRLIQ